MAVSLVFPASYRHDAERAGGRRSALGRDYAGRYKDNYCRFSAEETAHLTRMRRSSLPPAACHRSVSPSRQMPVIAATSLIRISRRPPGRAAADFATKAARMRWREHRRPALAG